MALGSQFVAVMTRTVTGCETCDPTRCSRSLLQKTQQFRLDLHLHVADFIEKQCAAVGRFAPSLLIVDRARECALFVTKKQTLGQTVRNGCHIHRNEWPVRLLAVPMNGLSHQLLTRAAFAVNHHARSRWRNFQNQLANRRHRWAHPHQRLFQFRQSAFADAVALNVVDDSRFDSRCRLWLDVRLDRWPHQLFNRRFDLRNTQKYLRLRCKRTHSLM